MIPASSLSIDPRTNVSLADYSWLPPQHHAPFQATLEQDTGVAIVHFVAEIEKMHKNELQQRVLVVATEGVYICTPHADINRCIVLELIEEVLICDEWICLCVPTQYDLVFRITGNNRSGNCNQRFFISILNGLLRFHEVTTLQPRIISSQYALTQRNLLRKPGVPEPRPMPIPMMTYDSLARTLKNPEPLFQSLLPKHAKLCPLQLPPQHLEELASPTEAAWSPNWGKLANTHAEQSVPHDENDENGLFPSSSYPSGTQRKQNQQFEDGPQQQQHRQQRGYEDAHQRKRKPPPSLDGEYFMDSRVSKDSRFGPGSPSSPPHHALRESKAAGGHHQHRQEEQEADVEGDNFGRVSSSSTFGGDVSTHYPTRGSPTHRRYHQDDSERRDLKRESQGEQQGRRGEAWRGESVPRRGGGGRGGGGGDRGMRGFEEGTTTTSPRSPRVASPVNRRGSTPTFNNNRASSPPQRRNSGAADIAIKKNLQFDSKVSKRFEDPCLELVWSELMAQRKLIESLTNQVQILVDDRYAIGSGGGRTPNKPTAAPTIASKAKQLDPTSHARAEAMRTGHDATSTPSRTTSRGGGKAGRQQEAEQDDEDRRRNDEGDVYGSEGGSPSPVPKPQQQHQLPQTETFSSSSMSPTRNHHPQQRPSQYLNTTSSGLAGKPFQPRCNNIRTGETCDTIEELTPFQRKLLGRYLHEGGEDGGHAADEMAATDRMARGPSARRDPDNPNPPNAVLNVRSRRLGGSSSPGVTTTMRRGNPAHSSTTIRVPPVVPSPNVSDYLPSQDHHAVPTKATRSAARVAADQRQRVEHQTHKQKQYAGGPGGTMPVGPRWTSPTKKMDRAAWLTPR